MSLVVKNVLGELTLKDVYNSIFTKAFAIYVVSEMKFGLDWHKTFSTVLVSDCKCFKDYLLIQARESGGVWHGEHELKLSSKVKVLPTHVEIIERNAKMKIEFMEANPMNLDCLLPRR
jgi:hypothetical protein